ncbi:uncharacterized protein B0T23DRAFT_360943 [Neurospora hispaniola]|uniref:Uncharacterized protein n=1 Tax=Neurospora hispaniola TaxID=588809 RepID=A0AAJ0I691_9PEZI|nr:hypothetical protein B0T23DRAFT_360943 [Neurospora hispaniola]
MHSLKSGTEHHGLRAKLWESLGNLAAIRNIHSLNCNSPGASVPIMSMIQVPSLRDNRLCHKPFPSPNLNLNLNLDNNLYPNHPPLDQNSRSPTVIPPRVPTTSSIAAHPVQHLSNSYHSVIPHSSRPPAASNRLESHVASTSKITP